MSTKESTLMEPTSEPRGRSFMFPDEDTKDIKNIYVDILTLNSTSTRETDVLRMHNIVPATKNLKQDNSFMSGIAPHGNSDSKDSVASKKELVVGERISTGVSSKPPHRRRPSGAKLDIEELSSRLESVLKSGSDTATNTNIKRRLFADDPAKDSSKEKNPTSTSVEEEFHKSSSSVTLPKDNGDVSVDSNKGLKSVKYVNGVAVVSGRTRSLVEKFEKRDTLTDECQEPDLAAHKLPNTDNVFTPTVEQSINVVSCANSEARTSPIPLKTPHLVPCLVLEPRLSSTTLKRHDVVFSVTPEAAKSPMPLKVPKIVPSAQPVTKTSQIPLKIPDMVSSAAIEAKTYQTLVKTLDSYPEVNPELADSSPVLVVQTTKTSPSMVREKVKVSPIQRSVASRRLISEKVRTSPMLVTRRSRASSHIPEQTRTSRPSPLPVVPRHDISTHMTTDKAKSSSLLEDNPQTTGRCMRSKDDDVDVSDDLMLDHESVINNLRSRLTKLQVVRHFWERNDMLGAINALQKLPDHAVQADVISVMLVNIESLTLDLFSCLLPLLLGLLDSETERHINVSLEMLLKLVVVFGPVITSTISALPAIGVNIQAEKRLESCNQCHVQLQKIQTRLPGVIRLGGLTARSAQELSLILQQL